MTVMFASQFNLLLVLLQGINMENRPRPPRQIVSGSKPWHDFELYHGYERWLATAYPPPLHSGG